MDGGSSINVSCKPCVRSVWRGPFAVEFHAEAVQERFPDYASLQTWWVARSKSPAGLGTAAETGPLLAPSSPELAFPKVQSQARPSARLSMFLPSKAMFGRVAKANRPRLQRRSGGDSLQTPWPANISLSRLSTIFHEGASWCRWLTVVPFLVLVFWDRSKDDWSNNYAGQFFCLTPIMLAPSHRLTRPQRK